MLRDLDIKKVYSSSYNDLIEEFYNPVLKESIAYKRISGYFTSSSLVSAAQGIASFITNHGKYQLITGVELSKEDYQTFCKTIETSEGILTNYINIKPEEIEAEIYKDHLKILAWLLSTGRLEIKIAVLPHRNAIFHEKIGIFQDKQGNIITFSGSINETGSGWLDNIEEFKVFRSWVESETEYLYKDVNKFEKYWENRDEQIKVVGLPTAIKNQILKIRPNDEELPKILERIRQNKSSTIILRDYQKEAISSWINNNCRGIFEMATGTGKTITSLSAISEFTKKEGQYCNIVIVPYKHLIRQWRKDIIKILKGTLIIEAYSDNPKWKDMLNQFLCDYRDGFINKITIITSYDTISTESFLTIFTKYFNQKRLYILIADEVHNFGASKRSLGMIEQIPYRLGLSATPSRWFDEEGTDKIIHYFGKTIFEYDLAKAIKNNFLCRYDYHPQFVELDSDEFEEYCTLTEKITRSFHINKGSGENDYLKLLLIKRSKIVKKAKEKIRHVEVLLQELIRTNQIDHLLIYCDSTDQIELIQQILNKYGVVNHTFTQKETIDERDALLFDFDSGAYSCLIAMKCLDEGVDVPSTKIAIIIASSTNPREYVQRRGRVLRKFEGKDKAVIYDYTVLPPQSYINSDVGQLEKQILKKEFIRIQEFLETADNKIDIYNKLIDIMLKYNVYLY